MFKRIYTTEYPIQHEIRKSSAVSFEKNFTWTKGNLPDSSANSNRKSDRNNQELNLLGTPGYLITLSQWNPPWCGEGAYLTKRF